MHPRKRKCIATSPRHPVENHVERWVKLMHKGAGIRYSCLGNEMHSHNAGAIVLTPLSSYAWRVERRPIFYVLLRRLQRVDLMRMLGPMRRPQQQGYVILLYLLSLTIRRQLTSSSLLPPPPLLLLLSLSLVYESHGEAPNSAGRPASDSRSHQCRSTPQKHLIDVS